MVRHTANEPGTEAQHARTERHTAQQQHTDKETHKERDNTHNKGLTRHTQCVIIHTVRERRHTQ